MNLVEIRYSSVYDIYKYSSYEKGGRIMFKKLLLVMTIMTLFVASPKKQNDIFTAAEDDCYEWNSYEVEDPSL